MKFFFTLIFLFVITCVTKATVVTVTCQNSPSHFLPVTINVTVGDTIHWTWVAGVHVVGPIDTTDIPHGAAMWNAPIDASHLTFDYVVTVPGHYHYVCHPATPHGEDAYIVVTAATTGVQESTGGNLSSAYPNPFAGKITIETVNADQILIYNLLGEKIKSFPVKSGQNKTEIDLSVLPSGVFLYSTIKEGTVLETRRIVKGQ